MDASADREPRILEIGGGLPIWHVGRILASLGADVLRVEPPGGLRIGETDIEANQILNGRKGSVEADLRTEEGRARVREDLRNADVLLIGLRPSTAREWGLTPAQLSEFDNLIHASITVFGSEGPYSELAGHDVNATAVSGVAWVEGTPRGMILQRTPIADLASSLFTVIGVLDALNRRREGATGLISLEVSMAEASLAFLCTWAPWFLVPRKDTLDSDPFYGLYTASDGISLAVGAVEQWQQEAISSKGPGSTNGPTPVEEMNEAGVARIFSSLPAERWLQDAAREGLAISPLNPPWQVTKDPQLRPRLLSGLDPEDPWRRVLYPVLETSQTEGDGVSPEALERLLFSAMTAERDADNVDGPPSAEKGREEKGRHR